MNLARELYEGQSEEVKVGHARSYLESQRKDFSQCLTPFHRLRILTAKENAAVLKYLFNQNLPTALLE